MLLAGAARSCSHVPTKPIVQHGTRMLNLTILLPLLLLVLFAVVAGAGVSNEQCPAGSGAAPCGAPPPARYEYCVVGAGPGRACQIFLATP